MFIFFVDSCTFDIKNNENLVYIPTTFNPGEKCSFSISISYPKNVTCQLKAELIDPLFTIKSVQGEWTKDTAGGCYNIPYEWQKNPKYEFHLTQETKVQGIHL